MDIKQIIETELRCVQSDCDRDCAKCELVMDTDEIVNAYKQVIEMLEHESDDCIDRQDMLDAIGHGTTYTSEELQEIVRKLPRTIHLRKKGEWVKEKDCYYVPTICSICGKQFTDYIWGYEWEETGELPNFCPNCGVVMI